MDLAKGMWNLIEFTSTGSLWTEIDVGFSPGNDFLTEEIQEFNLKF